MKQFTAIGVLLVSACAAAAPAPPAPYYTPAPPAPYYTPVEPYLVPMPAYQYQQQPMVYYSNPYDQYPVATYRYRRQAQELDGNRIDQNRRAGPPPPPLVPAAVVPQFEIPAELRQSPDSIASGSSQYGRSTPHGPDYVDYGAYTGGHGAFGWYSDHPVGGGYH